MTQGTTTKQEQIAQFLNERCSFPRCRYRFRQWEEWPPIVEERPTAEALAKELLAIAEFRALQLGTWLGTTDGQIITEAVEMVAPPFYRQDIELLVEALKLAAAMQQSQGQDKAFWVGVGFLAAAGIGAAITNRAA